MLKTSSKDANKGQKSVVPGGETVVTSLESDGFMIRKVLLANSTISNLRMQWYSCLVGRNNVIALLVLRSGFKRRSSLNLLTAATAGSYLSRVYKGHWSFG